MDNENIYKGRKMNVQKIIVGMSFTLVLFVAGGVAAAVADGATALSIDAILQGVENRYGGSAFSARFFQESTLKAMSITDTAQGRVWIKRPGKMRWEYETPEPQTIMTDGMNLWLYRPAERQVMVGSAAKYFGGGRGASFLTDLKLVREEFTVTIGEGSDGDRFHFLKLVPNTDQYDLTAIHLTISRSTFDILYIITTNSYGDETRIEMSDLQLDLDLSDSFFSFDIPEGTDVLQID